MAAVGHLTSRNKSTDAPSRSSAGAASGNPTRNDSRRRFVPHGEVCSFFPLRPRVRRRSLEAMSKELRIRNLPDKLHRQLEAEAGAIGLPLEDYLLTLVLRTLTDRPPRRPAKRSLGSQRRAFYEQAALECLSTLTEPEANVIKMRFGIGDAAPHSLQAIADTMGISKQRV